ncbi:rasGAP-activating-like protein 1 isoform X2 [Salvelinus alpinus]|uniref:rasGAP-activating-like protein 1 isoform X2 n=1 Tax=Salvelinus alpinus TaxID=8036 RepID=UPI0039FC100C
MCLLIYWHIECFLSRHWALWNLCACRCTSEMRPSGHYQPLTELLCQSMGPHLNSVNELNQWLLALRKACSHNRHSFHPGVYTGERWSCCHQKDKAGEKKLDGVTRLFSVLQDLQDSHTAVEERRSKNRNFLLELQT